MNPLRCLITGADFLDTEQNKWIHGDLHQLHDTLIFNASGCQWNQIEQKPLPDGAMAIRADYYYERNGQIVFPLEFAAFNDHANHYLTEMLNKAGGHGKGMTMMMVDVNDLEKILGGH